MFCTTSVLEKCLEFTKPTVTAVQTLFQYRSRAKHWLKNLTILVVWFVRFELQFSTHMYFCSWNLAKMILTSCMAKTLWWTPIFFKPFCKNQSMNSTNQTFCDQSPLSFKNVALSQRGATLLPWTLEIGVRVKNFLRLSYL